MIGENRQFVTDEPVSLRNNRVKIETGGKSPIVLKEFIEEYTPLTIKENRRMTTCNQLDLQTLGSQLTMPEHLPHHWLASYRSNG
jgi:hypothetical protein